MTPDWQWTDHAACLDTPRSLWFPTDAYGRDQEDVVPPGAAALCAGCPVRADCLEYALGHEDHGVWAATSPKLRRRMRRSMRVRREELSGPVRRARLLATTGMTSNEIAEEIGVSQRTVFRHLERAQ